MTAPLFLVKSLSDPCLCGTVSKISKVLSLPYAPGQSQTAASLLHLHWLFVLVSFKGGDSVSYVPEALPEPILLIFKVPGFQSHWF